MQAMSDMQTINNRVCDTVYIAFFVDSGFGLVEKVRFRGGLVHYFQGGVDYIYVIN
jgi:hypothetical protein